MKSLLFQYTDDSTRTSPGSSRRSSCNREHANSSSRRPSSQTVFTWSTSSCSTVVVFQTTEKEGILFSSVPARVPLSPIEPTDTNWDNSRPIRRATSCLGSFDWVDVKTTVVVVFTWTGNEAGPQLTASQEGQRRCRLHLIWDSLFSHFISEELIRWIFVTALRSVGLKPLLITMVTRSSLYRAEPLLRSICLIWSQFIRSRCSSTHSETCLHL